ncbi:hypothetical protein ACFOUV_14915 [Oceanobacillus longus]|uniref:Uncharacterized protein n=1 Tax=Oceanobacillus longus TaxID=930120 RepID=A0ABV8GZ19_9BACI
MKIRRLKSHEYAEAIKLADVTFRDGTHTSMGDAFPQVFSPAFVYPTELLKLKS